MAATESQASLAVFLHGSNDHGALCLPLQAGCEVPTRLLALRSQFLRTGCAGLGWTAVATGDGGFFAWGSGELPAALHGAPEGTCALVCGPQHAYALTDEGELHTWEYHSQALLLEPQKVMLPIEVGQLACGDGHVLALADGGIVFSWGRGVEGQLGRPPPLPTLDPTPRRIDDGLPEEFTSSVVAVACGGVHSILLTAGGELLGCGPRALLAATSRARCSTLETAPPTDRPVMSPSPTASTDRPELTSLSFNSPSYRSAA